MRKKWVIGLVGVVLLTGMVAASAYEMTPERKAWLATNPYKGVTVRVLTLKATVSLNPFLFWGENGKKRQVEKLR